MRKLLLYIFLIAASTPLFAYDFCTLNTKGDTLYYNVTSDSTVEVTYDVKVNRPTRFNFRGHIVIPSTVSYESKSYKVTRIGDMAFKHCPLIDSVTIPEGVETIGGWAFMYSGLRWVSPLTVSLKEIGECAFGNCDSLVELHFTSPYCRIGGGAFSGCSSLREVTLHFRRAVLGGECFSGDNNLRRVQMPDSMDVIPTSTFMNCCQLDSIVIPAGVSRIGYTAFIHCSSLVSVKFSTPGTLDSLGVYAFQYCASLSTMDLSQTKIRELSQGAFKGCQSLRDLKLPSTLRVIATDCLWNAKSLRYLVIPESIEHFSYNATWSGGFGVVGQDSSPVRINFIMQSKTPPDLYMYFFGEPKIDTTDSNCCLHIYYKDTFYVPCGYEQVYRNATDRNWIIVKHVMEASYAGEIFLDSVCGPEVQQRYGFYPDHSGDYLERFNSGYACDSIAIFHITLAAMPVLYDTTVQIEPDRQDTSVLWTWEGTGYAYNVYRDGDYITTVEQPYYLDTNIEMDVQYCYNFAPVNERYCEGKWSTTNCYTMLSDTTGVAEHAAAHSLVIYPNPAKNVLFISANEPTNVNGHINGTSYEITDVTGRMVLQGSYNATEGIHVGNLAKGVYLLRMEGKVGKFGKN